MSKGHIQRKTDKEKFSEGWDRIFNRHRTHVDDGMPEAMYQQIVEREALKAEMEKVNASPKDANIHPSCAEPFCSCVDKCVQMEPIKPGDLHK